MVKLCGSAVMVNMEIDILGGREREGEQNRERKIERDN